VKKKVEVEKKVALAKEVEEVEEVEELETPRRWKRLKKLKEGVRRVDVFAELRARRQASRPLRRLQIPDKCRQMDHSPCVHCLPKIVLGVREKRKKSVLVDGVFVQIPPTESK
jgi:hypothetical protein